MNCESFWNHVLLGLLLGLCGAMPVDQWQKIAPSITGPIDDIGLGKHHLVYVPSNSKRISTAIVVFLPGTTWPPYYYQQFLDASAQQGFITVGLAYDWANFSIQQINEAADDNHNPKLWGDIHRAVVSGGLWPEAKWTVASPTEDVSVGNSVIVRLRSLLKFCSLTSALHDDGTIDWNQIIISGHSQGGVHATYIAKQFQVRALLSFSGQGEHNSGWLDAEFATPREFLHLVTHSEDELGIEFSWINVKKMGLDSHQTCYSSGEAVAHGCVFIILTKAIVPRHLQELHPYHESTLTDRETPVSQGLPVMLPLWHGLLQKANQHSLQQRGQNHYLTIYS